MPAALPTEITFKSFNEYEYNSERPVNVCHVIESLGLGGAQTMMLELANGLNSYFGQHSNNYVLCVNRKLQKSDTKLLRTYGVTGDSVIYSDLKEYLKKLDPEDFGRFTP